MPVTRATAPRGVSTGFRMWKARLVPSAAIAMGTAEKARVVALRKRLGGCSHRAARASPCPDRGAGPRRPRAWGHRL